MEVLPHPYPPSTREVKLPQSVFFAWLAYKGRLQTRVNLCKKKILDSDTCVVCKVGPETTSHILFHCSFANALWATTGIAIPPNMHCSRLHELAYPLALKGRNFSGFILLCCWHL
jgi:hypothetical protein